MRKYILVQILIVCFVILNLNGCVNTDKNTNKTGKMDIQNNNLNKKREMDMINNNIPYSIRQYISFAMGSDDIEKMYGKPDVVREVQDKNYEIRNMSDGSLLFVFYEKETNIVCDIWRLNKLLSHQSFEKIDIGKATSEDIKKIDPYTVVFDPSKEKAFSEHRLINNEVAIIKYKKNKSDWVVDEINYTNPDPSGFTTTITKDDLLSIS